VRIPPGQHLPFDPFDGRPFRLRVAGRPLHPSAWIVVDDRYDADMAEKDRLLASPVSHQACVAVREGAEDACSELFERIVDHIGKHLPGLHGLGLPGPVDLSPIDCAGRLTQEDWCVLTRPNEQAPFALSAASLCFPNRWVLAEKLGRPISAIHEPVPQYAEQISAATDALLHRLTPDRPVWRINWSITDDARLHQPSSHGGPTASSRVVDDIGQQVFLRIERQTLVQLPKSRAVVFGIRTIVRTLDDVLRSDPTAAERMATSLRTMPDGMRAYKSLGRLGPLVMAWLGDNRPSSA
jgi:dimethylamine monooxygenase subunit A